MAQGKAKIFCDGDAEWMNRFPPPPLLDHPGWGFFNLPEPGRSGKPV